ncbi:MAG TPA: polysaccharide biosynthesis tyrosine autokinase [Candidatus Paceibacterota bacterium]|nr:polysaccharide biosynthesis tyrosine autokinase [Candidatus Paceibacterota bacterium]
MSSSNQHPSGDSNPPPQDGYGYGYGYGASSQRSSDLARTWHALIDKAWVIGITTACLLAVGYVYIRRSPVLYSATAIIQAEQDQPDILKGIQITRTKDLQAVDYLQTVAQTLTSRPVLERVAETNALWNNSQFLARTDDGTNEVHHRKRVLGKLEKMVQVKLRRGTRLIDVTVRHEVPEITEQIANAIVSAYVETRAERDDSSINVANQSLTREAERLRRKLEQSENALQTYKEENSAASLDDRQNTVVAKLNELNSRATEAKSARIKTETEYEQVLKIGTNMAALLNVPAVARDQTVVALELGLTRAEDDFAAVRERYKSKHPKYIQALTQIGKLKEDLNAAVLGAVETLKASLNSARAAEAALNEALQAQETAVLELSKLSIQYGVLKREVDTDRALYDAVLKGMKEASVSQATQQGGIIRLVEPAYLPERPVSPRKAAILAVSGLGGIFLGVLIVMGLRVADTSIKTVDEAELNLGLSVVSVVPNMSELRNGKSRLVVVEDARSEAAEAFRTLRTSMSTLNHAEERRVSLFTSAMPSEGKTFCSVNYAASLAQLGRKTLLIDADLRHPSVEITLAGRASGTPGLSDLLAGMKTFDQVIQSTAVENLFMMSGGSIASNPAELLAVTGLSSVIQEALKHYDRVVVDSAPINAVSDTLLILKSAQAVCLVVRVGRTSSRYVLRCVQLLQGAEAPISGIILNRMPQRRGIGYGAYYDYHYHGKYSEAGTNGKH